MNHVSRSAFSRVLTLHERAAQRSPRAPFVLGLLFAAACTNGLAGPPPSTDGGARDAEDGDSAEDAEGSLSSDEVEVAEGRLRGTESDGVVQFLGVPYAEPPVGARRFLPAEPLSPWEGVREAREFGSPCTQIRYRQGSDEGELAGSEDCLFLNVWTPALSPGALPVMVFIHGGGNVMGAASETSFGAKLFDGKRLARRGQVVVVTLDYRVGPLGFLVHPALDRAGEDGGSGNLGLRDQIEALRWIQENVGALGGDPARVMLFGESAGALDTCMLLASPLASGLYTRAAMQSGGCVAKARAEREEEGRQFAAMAGCPHPADAAACLRAKTAEDLASLVPHPFASGVVTMSFGPVIDGRVLPEDPMQRIAEGRHNHVPLIIGTNRDETSATIPPGTTTPESFRTFLELVVGPDALDRALELYPPGTNSSEARWSQIRATSDAQFVCPARTIARSVSMAQEDPVYRYSFDHVLGGVGGRIYGAPHGIELFFVFDTLRQSDYGPDIRAIDEDVIESVVSYWTRFAATGDPNAAGSPRWPAYDPGLDPYLSISPEPTALSGLRAAHCDFWQEVSLDRSAR